MRSPLNAEHEAREVRRRGPESCSSERRILVSMPRVGNPNLVVR